LTLLLAFCSLIQSPAAVPANYIANDPTAREIDTYVRRHVPFGYSGSVLIAKKGQVLLNKGYGLADDSRKVPNTSETVFSLGSITKQFTATAILKLEEMGKLRVEDPISKHLPGVPDDKKEITIHQLLRHTGAIVDVVAGDYEAAERDETVRKALAAPLTGKPGEAYRYSNLGYTLLAAIVERASGMSYEQFLQTHLFTPAGMKMTGYRLPDWSKATVASAYAAGKRTPPNPELTYPTWNVMGNGEVLSTTGDMFRWHQAITTGRVLSEASLRKMLTPGLGEYGYGWVISDTPNGKIINHNGGSSTGTGAFVGRFPDSDTLVIFFVNRDVGKIFGAGWEERLPRLAFGQKVPMPPMVDPSKQDTSRFAGTYEAAGGGRITVLHDGSGLRLSPMDGPAARIFIGSGYLPSAPEATRAPELLRELLAGELDKAKVSISGGEAVTPGVAQRLTTLVKDLEADYGKLKGIDSVFAAQSPDRPGAVQVIVRFSLEKADRYLSTHWEGGQYVGRTRTRALPAELWTAMDRSGTMVVYESRSGLTVRLKADGNALRLVDGASRDVRYVKAK
jgi:CubicO group peptidase (beta-lactamase class C family)